MALRQLRSALHAFTREAAWQLASDAGGDDLPFEVVESGRGVSPLYCYRPLTSDFIDAHGSVLSQLPTYLPAAHALAVDSIGRIDAITAEVEDVAAQQSKDSPAEAREVGRHLVAKNREIAEVVQAAKAEVDAKTIALKQLTERYWI